MSVTPVEQQSDPSGFSPCRSVAMAQPPCSVEQYYLGVDVGTASVRVALVTRTGLVKATAEGPIRIWEPSPGHYVQSSDDIWEQCCCTIRVGASQCGCVSVWVCLIIASQGVYISLPRL